MDIEAINILAKQCGATTCRHRHSPDAVGMIFHPVEWQKFCKALAEQPATAQPDHMDNDLTMVDHFAGGGKPMAEQPSQEQQCKHGNEPASCTSSPMDCQCALDSVFEEPAQKPEMKLVAYAIVGDGKFGKYTWGMVFEDIETANHAYWSARGYELHPLYAIQKDKSIIDEFCKKNGITKGGAV